MRYLNFEEYAIKEANLASNPAWLRKKLVDFFTNTKDMDDTKVHALAEELEIDTHEFETAIYSILVDFFQYGKYNKALESNEVEINQEELEVGIRFEMEHTACTNISRRIALDHLVDDPKYYTHLKEMEDKYQGVEDDKLTKGDDEDGIMGDKDSN